MKCQIFEIAVDANAHCDNMFSLKQTTQRENIMKTDINYTINSFHVCLLPNNDQAVEVCNQVTKYFGGNVPISAWASVKHQFKAAKYSVRKLSASKNKITNSELLDILNSDPLGLLD